MLPNVKAVGGSLMIKSNHFSTEDYEGDVKILISLQKICRNVFNGSCELQMKNNRGRGAIESFENVENFQ